MNSSRARLIGREECSAQGFSPGRGLDLGSNTGKYLDAGTKILLNCLLRSPPALQAEAGITARDAEQLGAERCAEKQRSRTRSCC